MPAPYSNDLRQRVIDAYQGKEGSLRKLAERFKVSLSFIQRLIRQHRYTGKLSPKPHAGGASAKLRNQDLLIVQQLVDEQPDALLWELCERLANHNGVQVSVSTMHRAVQRLQLTTKKNTLCQ